MANLGRVLFLVDTGRDCFWITLFWSIKEIEELFKLGFGLDELKGCRLLFKLGFELNELEGCRLLFLLEILLELFTTVESYLCIEEGLIKCSSISNSTMDSPGIGFKGVGSCSGWVGIFKWVVELFNIGVKDNCLLIYNSGDDG